MKLFYKDLINHLKEKPSKKSLSNMLFQLGHEHEIDGDIFNMELTPNRGDCLSLIGLARDLNVYFGNSDTISIYKDSIDDLDIDFENLSPNDCTNISFLEIEIEETVNDYKPYLENYFKFMDHNKTNFFTDISNYISYEMGQPTHCFDKDTINSKIVFENKECNKRFKTLLGSEIKLSDHNCIFSMGEEIISLAGVMGGASTSCSNKTKKVLIECAYFNPESIIGKSVKYNLVSDAAHKFERGVDILSQEKVLRRFLKVVQDHAHIKSAKFKSFSFKPFQNHFISIDVNKINKVLGTSFNDEECFKYLRKLGFEISNKIKVPSYRHDVKTNNDLAEEIARVIGFNNIKSSPIKLNKVINKNNDKIKNLESFFVKNGFSEVINFPFTSKKENHSISLDNPLDSNRKNIRISLMDSLIGNLLYNERRQKDCIKLFEISDIYSKEKEIKQDKKVGIIISGRLGNNYNDFSKKLDKNYIHNLLNEITEDGLFYITEIPRNTLDTKRKDKIFYAEIFLNEISNKFYLNLNAHEKIFSFVDYKPISEFPSSTRDFSFSINDLQKVNEVIELLERVSDDIIKDSFIFDYYKNHKTNSIKLGYRFIFQSRLKTLSDSDINNKVKEIIDPILEIDGVDIPGIKFLT